MELQAEASLNDPYLVRQVPKSFRDCADTTTVTDDFVLDVRDYFASGSLHGKATAEERPH